MSDAESNSDPHTTVISAGWTPPTELTARLRLVSKLAAKRGGWSTTPALWVIASPEDTPDEIELSTESKNALGRGNQAPILVGVPSLSRNHFSIEYRDETWWINDLGSSNGTRLNGLALTAPSVLCDGDWIEAGRLLFVANLPETQED